MRRLPPLNALRAFEATARLSSVTAAAAELGVSHSAISQQVKLLEDYFGQKLFTRPGRRVEPTPAAVAFLEDIRSSFDRIAVASEQLTRRGGRRILTISATPSVAVRWLIPKTAEFQLAYPAVEIRVTTSSSDGISHLDGPYDFIIRRDVMTRRGHTCRRLIDDESTPVMHPQLMQKRQIKQPADLLKLPLLHMRSRPDYWKMWFDQQGVTTLDTIDGPFFDHFFLSLQAAINGLGAAMAPHALVGEDLAEGRLVAPFPELTLKGPGFHILYRDSMATDRGGRRLLAWLEAETGASLVS